MQRVQCDVLVIGSGMAGFRAALRAVEVVPRVVLVDKGKVSRAGKSAFAGFATLYPAETDDLSAWHRELVERGNYISDQDWVKVMLEETPQRIQELIDWGASYEKDEKGRPLRSSGMAHEVTRVATFDSLQTFALMRERAKSLGITILDRVMITGLLTADGGYPTGGAIVGAFGFGTLTGETYVINAKATVATTGGSGWYDLSSDGVVESYRAGAEVSNVEFGRLWDHVGLAGKYAEVRLNAWQRAGMVLRNSNGERFMERYHPQLKEKVSRFDFALPIVIETLQGRGPVSIDLTQSDPAALDRLRNLPTTSRKVRGIEREGINLSKQLVPINVFSGFLISQVGGLRNNISGETNLAGLYAAGEAGGYPSHGTYTVGGVNIAMCNVSGYRAGESAARFAQQAPSRPVNEGQVKQLEKETFAPMNGSNGLRPHVLMDEMEEYLSPATVAIFRNARTIQATIAKTQEWESQAHSLQASDLHEMVKANKARNYAVIIRLFSRASLEREECRGPQVRTDFRYKDNVNWLKWVVMRPAADGSISVQRVPIPLDRYPVKPEKYEKIPFTYPVPKDDGRGGLQWE